MGVLSLGTVRFSNISFLVPLCDCAPPATRTIDLLVAPTAAPTTSPTCIHPGCDWEAERALNCQQLVTYEPSACDSDPEVQNLCPCTCCNYTFAPTPAPTTPTTSEPTPAPTTPAPTPPGEPQAPPGLDGDARFGSRAAAPTPPPTRPPCPDARWKPPICRPVASRLFHCTYR